jgi:hypothetical protein
MSDDIIRNDEIQAVLVTYLKAITNITDLLVTSDGTATPDEIREDGWKGTEFTYPNIRIRMIRNEPIISRSCYQRIEVSFLVFSEQSSSLEADKIAGIIGNELHEHPFSASGLAVSLSLRNLVPAIWSGEHIWRSEVIMSGIVSG